MKDLGQYKKHSDLVWNIANLLRGPYRPPQYRRVMIPLTVLKRLDSVLLDTKPQVLAQYDKLIAAGTDEETIEEIINQKFDLKFFNTSKFTFKTLLDDPDKLAANLNNYIVGFSKRAREIIEKFSFGEEIEKLDDANRLYEVVKEMASDEVDFHPDSVDTVAMGYIFEDLVRRFNEQANEEAGDHYTPREVVKLMVNLLFTGEEQLHKAGKVIKIYDPTCGTGGILSEAERTIVEDLNRDANVELFGQEYNAESYAICGSDLMIKGEDVNNVVYGNTLGTGKFKEGFADGDGHPGEHFHYMAANPPFGVEWKPEKDTVTKEHDQFGFKGRFGPGLPRINDGALLFLMHMMAKMERPPETYTLPAPGGVEGGEGSRIAVIFNGSPMFTGDAGGGESNIRRYIIENDMLETIVGLPDQMFYNTGIYTYIWIVTNRKAEERQGKVQLINATDFAWKMKKSLGDKRKKLGEGQLGGNKDEPDHIAEITKIYAAFNDGETRTLNDIGTNLDSPKDKKRKKDKPIFVSKIFNNQDFGYLKVTVDRPLRLNFIVNDERIERVKQTAYFFALGESKKRKDKAKIAEEIALGKAQQQELLRVLNEVKALYADGVLVKNRKVIEEQLKGAFATSVLKFDAAMKKALLCDGVLGEKDPTAEPCLDSKNRPEPDADLRDFENVPFPGGLLINGKRDEANELIELPLPLDYETKKTKGKVDTTDLLNLVQQHCEDFLTKEVLPYRDDAWIDHSKIKVGYEVPFNRHFYEYEKPQDLGVIEKEIGILEQEIVTLIKGGL
ncbi:type I restriction-modification system subunit M [Vibrio splendidus]|uniref:type I restriction-modification system subunit M n=1 Tax=Vibrio splendidus TaxID=29497 RepID=UPI00031FCD54|nr:class I SAM-dependent DNA methyltransferase [Vibrio splendidus]OEF39711.1 DNA methyltransferase [Vibrio splendidus 1S-124]PTQ17931.1 SAM-dependent DNA methyltransferase [Vibrio splendidus]